MDSVFKPAIWQIPAILAVTAGAAFLTYQYHPKRPALYIFQEVEGQMGVTLEELEGKELLWIDARSAADYEAAHIPDALLIDGDRIDVDGAFGEYAEAFQDSFGRTVVVYGDNAETVASGLRERGFWPEVFVLTGGFEAWVD